MKRCFEFCLSLMSFAVAMTAVGGETNALAAAGIFLECESFDRLGGWTVETQSMRQLGSSYVMAHGYGRSVEDAVTAVKAPEAGEYTVWARTRNWNAEWTKGAAGKFLVSVASKEKAGGKWNSATLGADSVGGWHWQRAGTVKLEKGFRYEVRLHDLTGFSGRCDALYLTTEGTVPPSGGAELDAWRHERTGVKVIDCAKTYDLIVVGGGMAGACAAIAVAELRITAVGALRRRNSTGSLSITMSGPANFVRLANTARL